jgi:phosphoglycolate phosphatase-like HAD superfamily hydrolase
MVCIAALAAIVTLAQACGGGSANEDASPTATSPPAATAGSETPGAGPSFTDQPGPGAQVIIGGATEEVAEFLGISQEQLESELSEEAATPASVAEAHDRTRDELETFYTEQQQAQLDEAVAAGDMSQEDADQALEAFSSRIDDVVDGNVPVGGGPGGGQVFFSGGASEELAAFLGIPLDQLESELSEEGATPASVAEAHDRTRDELETFYTEQQQAQLSEAVAAGTLSQDQADQSLEAFASRIDDIIDGNVPVGGGPGGGVITFGGPGMGLAIGGPSEELAAFLGVPLDQLESELSAEGATPASVAEAHDRTRDELETFYTEQVESQVLEAVVNGTMSPDEGDAMIERLTSNIDAIIDGTMPSGGPGFSTSPGQ